MYHFHCDDESLAWRLIGQGARMAVEIGLHRHETYANNFATDEERQSATVLFWSLYVLDRRWSFGTGMPFALQDADIDSLLPKTVRQSPNVHSMWLISTPLGRLNSLPNCNGRIQCYWFQGLAKGRECRR